MGKRKLRQQGSGGVMKRAGVAQGSLKHMKKSAAAADTGTFDDDPYNEVDRFHMDKDKLLLDVTAGDDNDKPIEREVYGIHGYSSDEYEGEEDDNADYQPEDHTTGYEAPSDTNKRGAMDSDLESDAGSVDSTERILASRSWGKKSQAYYGTDGYRGAKSRAEKEQMQDEEEETAIADKKILTSQLTEDDFQVDYLFHSEPTDATKEDEGPKTPHSFLSLEDKVSNLKRRCPELSKIIKDYNEIYEDFENRIKPIFLHTPEEERNTTTYQFMKLNYTVYAHYIMNLSIYFLLKLDDEPTTNHPVMEQLVTYRQHIQRLQAIAEASGNFAGYREAAEVPIFNQKKNSEESLDPAILLYKKLGKLQGLRRDLEDSSAGETKKRTYKRKQEEEVAISEDTKRKISKPILSNRSVADLEYQRTRKNKNPRTKNRAKFVVGTKRRKGQVRPMRDQNSLYQGEASGINKKAKRGIKLT